MTKFRKLAQRSIACTLALILLVASVGCSGGKKGAGSQTQNTATNEGATNNQPAESTADEVKGDGLPDTDLGGYVFKVADSFESRWAPEEGKSASEDKVLEMVRSIETRFNCKIEYVHTEMASFFETVQPAIMAGDKYADIIIPPMWGFGKFISADILVDLKTVPHLQLGKPHWNQNIIKMATIGGKSHGAANSFLSHVPVSWGLYFNKRIVTELGLEDPYKVVEEGKWTYDKFREYARAALKDLNGDGVMDYNDRFGLGGPEHDMFTAFFVGSGIKILDTDETGKVKYTLNNPKAFDAMTKLKQIIQGDKIMFAKKAQDGWTAYIDAFTSGKSLFLGYVCGLPQLRDMEDDFGYLPMPKLEESQEYRCSVDHNGRMLGIPMTNTDLEKTGLILEALAWKAQEENEIYFTDMGDTFFRDQQSADLYRKFSNYGSYDLALLAGMAKPEILRSGVQTIITVINNDPNAEPASSVTAVEEMANIAVDEFYNKN